MFASAVRVPFERVAAAIVADAKTWSWFPTFKDGATDGDHRRITVGGFSYEETILAQTESILVFRVDETTSPWAKAIVEEWRVEPQPDGATVRWTFAVDPGIFLRIPGSRRVIRAVFKRAMRNLEAQLA